MSHAQTTPVEAENQQKSNQESHPECLKPHISSQMQETNANMFHVDSKQAFIQDFKAENNYANDSIGQIDDSLIRGVDKNQNFSLFDPNFSIQQVFLQRSKFNFNQRSFKHL